jgi:hypothetical protein
MAGNRLVALPVDHFGLCKHGKCQGISLPSNSRNCRHAHSVRKNNIRPLVSSDYLSKKSVIEYHISRSLLCGYSLRNSFYGFENDSLVLEKREFRTSILSSKKDVFVGRHSVEEIL